MSISQTEFDALCGELSANNRHRLSIHETLPMGYGFRLGQALRHNTAVCCLYLDLRPSQVDGGNEDTGRRNDDNISMILQFLGNASSFRMVTFTHGTPVYTNPCLQAVSQNPSLLSFYLRAGVEVSTTLLAEWVGTTQTLQQVSLPSAVADDDQVAAALGTNSSIMHLWVDSMDELSTAAFLGPLSRRATPTRLHALRLKGSVLSTDVLAALSWFASSSSTILPSLSIVDVLFGKEFSTVMSALSSNPCMIARLELFDVTFDETTSTDILSSAEAQQQVNSRSSISTINATATFAPTAITPNATLQEIAIHGCEYYYEESELKVVTALTLNAQFTLKRLDWEWLDEQDDEIDHSLLWSKMEERICTHRIDAQSGLPFRRLRAIAFDQVLTSNNDAMFRCLPKLVSLEKLTAKSSLDEDEHQHSSTELLRFAKAIRCSGSLTTVKMHDQFQWSTNPTQADRIAAIVDAALQRNKMLPKLLSRPPPSAGKNPEDDSDRVQREGRYPHLFAVALPAESMTPHFVLMGLTAMGHDAEDKVPSGKRSARWNDAAVLQGYASDQNQQL